MVTVKAYVYSEKMKYQENPSDDRVERKIRSIKRFSCTFNGFIQTQVYVKKKKTRMHCKVFFVCFLINISSKECISCLTLLKACMQEGKTREGSWWGEMEGWTQKRKHHTQTWCFTNVWTHHWRGMEVFKVAATRWLLAQRNTYTQLKRSLKKYTLCGSSPACVCVQSTGPSAHGESKCTGIAGCERQKMDLSKARCSINET